MIPIRKTPAGARWSRSSLIGPPPWPVSKPLPQANPDFPKRTDTGEPAARHPPSVFSTRCSFPCILFQSGAMAIRSCFTEGLSLSSAWQKRGSTNSKIGRNRIGTYRFAQLFNAGKSSPRFPLKSVINARSRVKPFEESSDPSKLVR
jgi:hypothetical protein